VFEEHQPKKQQLRLTVCDFSTTEIVHYLNKVSLNKNHHGKGYVISKLTGWKIGKAVNYVFSGISSLCKAKAIIS
jgi:hypothetical protein